MPRPLVLILVTLAAASGALSPAVAFDETLISASDAQSNDEFGRAVSISGDFAASGSHFDDDLGSRSGSVYVYRREGANWIEEPKLLASDGDADDRFGFIVAISGSTLVVGAPFDESAGPETGAAYVFTRDASGWHEEAKLTASDAAEGDRFGYSVAVAGPFVVAGAHQTDDDGTSSGSAYVFRHNGAGWTQEAKLTASDASQDDYFGFAVSISGEYDLLIGAYRTDEAGPNSSSGSAYVFTRDGGAWAEQAKLVPSDPAAADGFGFSVAIQGEVAVVSAPWNDDAGSLSGSTYVFRRGGTSWAEEAKLTASDAASLDLFGHHLAISGPHIIVGAFGRDGPGSDAGAAYLYKHNGSAWVEDAMLTASDAGGGEQYGQAVAVSGHYALIGAPYDSAPSFHSGSAYVYELDLAWAPLAIDVDRDGDIDRIDYHAFASCQAGPGMPHPTGQVPGCGGYDSDADGDVDQSDFGAFQRCFSGDGNAYPEGC